MERLRTGLCFFLFPSTPRWWCEKYPRSKKFPKRTSRQNRLNVMALAYVDIATLKSNPRKCPACMPGKTRTSNVKVAMTKKTSNLTSRESKTLVPNANTKIKTSSVSNVNAYKDKCSTNCSVSCMPSLITLKSHNVAKIRTKVSAKISPVVRALLSELSRIPWICLTTCDFDTILYCTFESLLLTIVFELFNIETKTLLIVWNLNNVCHLKELKLGLSTGCNNSWSEFWWGKCIDEWMNEFKLITWKLWTPKQTRALNKTYKRLHQHYKTRQTTDATKANKLVNETRRNFYRN